MTWVLKALSPEWEKALKEDMVRSEKRKPSYELRRKCMTLEEKM